MGWQCFSIRHIYKIMFVIFKLDKILNPVVEAGEPTHDAISMEKKAKNYLDTDNINETTNFLQKGTL